MTNDVAIIGVGLHPFGRFEKTAMEMGAEAIQLALTDGRDVHPAPVQWYLRCLPIFREARHGVSDRPHAAHLSIPVRSHLPVADRPSGITEGFLTA